MATSALIRSRRAGLPCYTPPPRLTLAQDLYIIQINGFSAFVIRHLKASCKLSKKRVWRRSGCSSNKIRSQAVDSSRDDIDIQQFAHLNKSGTYTLIRVANVGNANEPMRLTIV